MTETLCGPSNPLQNFHKHTSVDRTLQQDRLALYKSTTEGFRSNCQPNTNNVNNELAAFQGHRLLGPPVQPISFTSLDVSSSFPHQSKFAPEPAPAANDLSQWASDFQNQLNITSSFPRTSPPQASSSASSLLRARNDLPSWHYDFLAQSDIDDPPPQLTSYVPYSNTPQIWNQPNPTSSLIGTDSNIYYPASQQQQQPPPQTVLEEKAYDEAAFERAFDAAKENISYLERTKTTVSTADHTHSNPKSNPVVRNDEQQRSQYTETQHMLNQQHLPYSLPQTQPHYADPHVNIEAEASDAAEAQLEANVEANADAEADAHADVDAEAEAEEKEANALAQTAAKVLDSVAHDTSQKFRQSTFLGLMRKLRDGEVRVNGDEMVDVNISDGSGGGGGGGVDADSIGRTFA